MITERQDGAVNVLLLPLIGAVLLLLGAIGFGVWAYGGMQDYKTKSDQKSASAVAAAVKAEDAKASAAYAEQAKNPLVTYNGPSDYGSLKVVYPKTWSAYVDDNSSGSNNNVAVDAYFYPGYVPSTDTPNAAYALRVQVVNQSYGDSLQAISGQQTQTNNIVVTPYSLPKLPSIIGSKLVGAVDPSNKNQTITMIMLPLRDKTVKVWTESSNFINDFNNIVLPNLTFSP